MADKVKITIEGVQHEVDAGENLLQACLDRGMLIPHFCYHEALGAAGACRLCAAMVAPAADKPPRLDMLCMLRAADGMVIDVNAPYAKEFRKGVMEALMLNHPHDCPVCDEGGECMLQDMTVLNEQIHRRTRFPKRTWENQHLGPLVHQEMNRCITCYRCVRYYRDYALGDDFGVYGSRGRVFFGRVSDGTLESEFAGNLVDVCPTGVFTDKNYREAYVRPWDLSVARSVCVHCSVGCNVLPGFRHELLRRVKPAPNPEVNRFFMCDRGRFGGEFVNSPARTGPARVNGEGMTPAQAIDEVADRLKAIIASNGPGSVAVVGSGRATLEANAALAVLAKAAGGKAVYHRTAHERDAVRRAAAIAVSGEVAVPTLAEMEGADLVISVGGDVTCEAPMMDLSVRQAIRNGAVVFVISPRAGKLDSLAAHAVRVRPGEETVILDQVLSGSVLSKSDLDAQKKTVVDELVAAFQAAKHPLVLCSTLHEDAGLVDACFWLAKRASRMDRKCMLAYYHAEANSTGIGLAHEDENPEVFWPEVASGKVKALVVLERDLARDFESPAALQAALAKCEFVVAVDSVENATTRAAHAVIPCAAHYQGFGTLLNYEGRGQRFDGLPITSAMATPTASEALLKLVQKMGAGELIAGADYHTVYDLRDDSGAALDALKAGDTGTRVRLASKLPVSKSPRRNLGALAKGGLLRWDIVGAFGSEELSSLSPAIAELAMKPAVELSPADAAERKLEDRDMIDLTAEFGVAAPVKLNADIAPGTAGIPLILTNTAVVPEEVKA